MWPNNQSQGNNWQQRNNSNWGGNGNGGNYGNNSARPRFNGGNGGNGGGNRSFGGNNNKPKRDPNTPITAGHTPEGFSVDTPYNANFVSAAKQLGGRWNSNAMRWFFDPNSENQVLGLLDEFFPGWDQKTPEPAPQVFSRPPAIPLRPAPVAAAPVQQQNGVARAEVAPAFLDETETNTIPVTEGGTGTATDEEQKIQSTVRARVHKLGEELSVLDFAALSSTELYKFAERLNNAARVLAFEAGVRHK